MFVITLVFTVKTARYCACVSEIQEHTCTCLMRFIILYCCGADSTWVQVAEGTVIPVCTTNSYESHHTQTYVLHFTCHMVTLFATMTMYNSYMFKEGITLK
jgi:hypothetical protein